MSAWAGYHSAHLCRYGLSLIAESETLKQQLKNLIERVLIARPDASTDDIRNLVPSLRDKSDQEIEKLLTPIRNHRAKNAV